MSEYVPRLDLWITQYKLPAHVYGFCKRVGSDDCVVINMDLSDEEKIRAIRHELRHLRNGDMNSEDTIVKIEGL